MFVAREVGSWCIKKELKRMEVVQVSQVARTCLFRLGRQILTKEKSGKRRVVAGITQ